jgi:hypothetical protein
MKRYVKLANGSRYTCKSIMFMYESGERNEQDLHPSERTHHSVSIILPDNSKSKGLTIIDCNQHLTMLDPEEEEEDEPKGTITSDQEGYVQGMFFLRTNHPSKLAAANKRKRIADKVNYSFLSISSYLSAHHFFLQYVNSNFTILI